MTHPTRQQVIPSLTDAVSKISDEEMTRMCLCVNQLFGNEQSRKLLDLILAARKATEDDQ